MGGGSVQTNNSKIIVVLGASYGGAHAAQVLAASVPDGWRVILIDRNSHMNHLYVMPRFAVLPGHEYKAFIPYTNVFLLDSPVHIHIQAQVTSIRPNHLTISRAFPELGIPTTTISFDYAIYALGARLPPPLNLWESPIENESLGERILQYSGLKTEGCEWLRSKQRIIERVPTVLVVGGGALGIQFATDIKDIYPTKKVTLLHSRLRLLPRFDEKMHNEVMNTCKSQGIEVILGERLDLDSTKNQSVKMDQYGQKVVRTVTGREIAADLILLCIGQAPNTDLLKKMDPLTVGQDGGLARVLRTMQLYSPPRTDKQVETDTAYPHIFAIGDAADAFGAIPAGHTAYAQADIAARNIIRLINRGEVRYSSRVQEPLEHYSPGPPAIKVSLGLKREVRQTGTDATVDVSEDGVADHRAAAMWPFFGINVEKDEDMIP
ncbi:hypothetical protein CPB84DRAFT_1838278 [Gymnopilus junonius]|uniref:FAD/NAD(P)-binding domain-containing protein n=1 Tax=Gymnopilus junonius TaxID=109634 RepID=A0A9P5ND91_GYMJU|nr:hypothetical protein CPB84DRAFT_1838278 [Gymnopilus junonius]